MGRTEIRSHQVFDGTIGRSDLNATSATESVILRVQDSSTGVRVKSSTGALSGTGDIQLEVDTIFLNSLYPNVTVSRPQNLFLATPASGGAGAAFFRNISVSDVPILNQDTTGNAATATRLATARTINGVSFNGTQNITVAAAAGTLTGTALNPSVVSSSLTSVGTLSSLSVTGAVSTGSLIATAITTDTLSGTTVSSGTFVAGTVDYNGAYCKSRFLGGVNTAEIYSDGENLVLANDNMIYLQSVTGSVLYAKGQKSGGDTWFEMMYNGTTRAKTVSSGFSVTGRGYFSNGIELTGDVKATGDGYFFNSVSDARMKKDLVPILPSQAIDLVCRSKPYRFTWREGKKSGQQDIGFIAQDFFETLPEMVMHRPDGFYGLYYEHYVVVLAAAVQYLAEQLGLLKQKADGQ
ncbi:MAG: tail fiber domain-containing protein [Candidatus Cloacimonetes bacterium]|nr:tail fiber domain-containing protein [Candidatus Cloacimonadota bacterium]